MKLTKIITVSALVLTALSTTAVAQAEEVATYESKGEIGFKPGSEITPPVNPWNPDIPVTPENPDGTTPEGGTKGPLSIDFASSITFGLNKISNKDTTYYAAPQTYAKPNEDTAAPDGTANYVQITDTRGNNAGWTLTVKQNGQFSHPDTVNGELTGSVLSFNNLDPITASVNMIKPIANKTIDLDPNGAESIVMSAAKGTGSLTWLGVFGELTDTVIEEETMKMNKDISLAVPGITPKDAVSYSTKLTWTLSDTPPAVVPEV